MIISDTNCVVSIYGLGINGRLFSEAGSCGKMLILEAYSIWNSKKYAVVMNIMQLRQLLSHRPDLLLPGKKSVVLKEIVKLLYFDYTISIEPYDEDATLGLADGMKYLRLLCIKLFLLHLKRVFSDGYSSRQTGTSRRLPHNCGGDDSSPTQTTGHYLRSS